MQADGFNGGKESDFNAAPNAITEDGPVANTIPIGEDTVVSPSFSEPNAVVQDAPVFEPVVTPPPEASAPRVSTPMTTAQDLRARAEAARAERMEREKASAAQNAAISTPMGVSGSADEVIKKIDRAAAEGAPLSTMKEIALQLQQERAKPENKTPEMQKRLSEAQVTLIKAMSSALRK